MINNPPLISPNNLHFSAGTNPHYQFRLGTNSPPLVTPPGLIIIRHGDADGVERVRELDILLIAHNSDYDSIFILEYLQNVQPIELVSGSFSTLERVRSPRRSHGGKERGGEVAA